MERLQDYRSNYRQFEKLQNTKEVNDLIVKIMWIFLCIPLIVMALSILGLYQVSWQFSLKWFLLCTLLDIVLTYLRKVGTTEECLKYILMISLETIVILLAKEPLIGIHSTYILVPIISCAYLDRKFTGKISLICYFMMLIGLFFRSKGIVVVDYPDYTRMHWFISFSSAYTIEYIALFGAIKLLSQRTENFVDNLTMHSQKIISMQQSTIGSFADLIESRDDSTGQHVKRTSGFVNVIINGMKENGVYQEELSNEFCDIVCQAAPLHDIGKIKISDTILCKAGRLTDEEFTTIKTHTTAGDEIIAKSLTALEEKEFIKVARDIALYHHEKWDGTGYPTGIKGEEIPISARIMAVADVFDALISKRCYKDAMGLEDAFGIIEESKGTHFDPLVVEAFINQKDKVIDLLK